MKQFSEDKVTIRIRVKRASVEPMRSQPLHTSQREVETKYRNEYANKYEEKGIETIYIDTRYILK